MPEQTTTPTPMNTPETHSSTGPVIGIAIIVVLLAVGGYYFWSTQLPTGTDNLRATPTTETSQNETWQAPASTSDAPADLQAEIDATDMAQFEAQMDADMAAVNAAL